MKILIAPCFLILLLAGCSTPVTEKERAPRFVGISPDSPGYFAFSDGTPYIPVGINMIHPSGKYSDHPDSAFVELESWMKQLSDNGGNYIRIWLSHSFWDIEETAGVYSDGQAKKIERFVELARKYGLRIKLTLEHFRSITLQENNQAWATKFAYHTSKGGPLDSIRQYIATDEGRKLFLNKLDFYKQRFGSDTIFFGWELWNEMNAMKGPEDSVFLSWNEKMLAETKARFPENLVMQSLGSFDSDNVRDLYKKMMNLSGNDVAQVHRYLDLGAKLAVCRESMDVIASSAVEELLSYELKKPILLAETGAVQPSHAGPSKYYPMDTTGMLLHDMLFAPFFSGSAGTGMSWHWESYVAKNNLWYHYGRFHEVIKGINPIKERFKPSVVMTSDLRIYKLSGKNTQLLWLRDKESTWQNEFDRGIAPRTLTNIMLTADELGLTGSEFIQVYDPWQNKWTDVQAKDAYYIMPSFKRSLVIRFSRTAKL